MSEDVKKQQEFWRVYTRLYYAILRSSEMLILWLRENDHKDPPQDLVNSSRAELKERLGNIEITDQLAASFPFLREAYDMVAYLVRPNVLSMTSAYIQRLQRASDVLERAAGVKVDIRDAVLTYLAMGVAMRDRLDGYTVAMTNPEKQAYWYNHALDHVRRYDAAISKLNKLVPSWRSYVAADLVSVNDTARRDIGERLPVNLESALRDVKAQRKEERAAKVTEGKGISFDDMMARVEAESDPVVLRKYIRAYERRLADLRDIPMNQSMRQRYQSALEIMRKRLKYVEATTPQAPLPPAPPGAPKILRNLGAADVVALLPTTLLPLNPTPPAESAAKKVVSIEEVD